MADYLRIASKIKESIWFITSDGMDLILEIFESRLSGGKLSDEEIAIRLQEAGAHGNEEKALDIQNGVGILPIHGPIFGKANLMTELSGATSMEAFRKDFASLIDNQSVSSILLDIDSPGGTSDMIAEAGAEILAGREVKPVYALANGQSGSAAYWLMSQATKGYSSPSGSVGSIGAFTVHEDQSVADANAGRKYTFVSAGRYKTEGNPHLPLSAEGREYRQEVINELYGEFVDAVALGRNTTADDVQTNYGQGRMLLPKKALEAGMIDGITEYSDLMDSLTAPQAVSVHIPGQAVARAVWDTSMNCYKLESADWEHSEPGTGPTPQVGSPEQPDPGTGHTVPRKPGNPAIEDPAIGGGWRREPLPLDPNDPHAPKPNSRAIGGSEVTDEELAQLRIALELPEGATVAQIITTASTSFGEAKSLKDAVALAGEEKRFAEQFPTMYREHQDLLAKNRTAASKQFSESVKQFARMEGEKFVPTDKGLSALARDTVAETHMKFAEGTATVADFEKCITTITRGGIVDYSEKGSDLAVDLVELDVNTPGGIANARKLFADKVVEVMNADKLDYNAAVDVAAQKYPDLAAAYRTPMPA